MSNYLPEIEAEYSRGRGKSSLLSPIDWHLAQSWEDSGIPLHIVLAAMGDGFKNFYSTKRKDTVNSLRYFTQEVEKQFAAWQTSQVGKSINGDSAAKTEEIMPQFTTAEEISLTDDNIQILNNLVANLTPESFLSVSVPLPEPLASAVARTRGEILAFIDDVQSYRLSIDSIEENLGNLARELEISLVISVTEGERAEMIESVRAERNGHFTNDEIIQKILMKKLYQKFNLPELTLFEF